MHKNQQNRLEQNLLLANFHSQLAPQTAAFTAYVLLLRKAPHILRGSLCLGEGWLLEAEKPFYVHCKLQVAICITVVILIFGLQNKIVPSGIYCNDKEVCQTKSPSWQSLSSQLCKLHGNTPFQKGGVWKTTTGWPPKMCTHYNMKNICIKFLLNLYEHQRVAVNNV